MRFKDFWRYDPFWRTRPLQYGGEFFYSVALVVFTTVALGIRGAERFLRDRGAEGWPQVVGSVTTGSVKTIHGQFIDYAVGQLGYSYNINGEYYSGYFTRQYYDEQTAWTFVDSHRNRPVVVRYKLSKPQASVLREADQSTADLA